MDKESLKKIVLDKIGSEDENAFSEFIKRISENLEENGAIEISEVGHFQLKKEPLSRMERRGSSADKNILLFLPSGSKSESEILTFELDEFILPSAGTTESVFEIGINKPTIISDSGTDNERISNKILEIVEDGKIIPNFDVFKNLIPDRFTTSNLETPFSSDDNEEFETKVSSEFLKDDLDVTEAEINKNFLSSTEEELSGLLDDNEDDVNEFDNENSEFEEISSKLETVITDDDVIDSEVGIIEDKFTMSPDNELESMKDDSEKADDSNPFDELEEYIKDDSTDEAQEILDDESDETLVTEEFDDQVVEVEEEIIATPEVVEEKKPKKEYSSYSSLRNKSKVWYKNPILFIALFSAIVAIAVVVMFWPANTQPTVELDGETLDFASNGNSAAAIDSAYEDIEKSETNNDLPNEQIGSNKIESTNKTATIIKNEIPEKKIQTKVSVNNTDVYRDIKNDQTITERIYFDGERYTVQSSSWKSKTIAEREVSKLRKRGFDAFIYKVYIASKGSTWNRVRIGYFNSRSEAEEFLKKNKI